MGIWRDTSGNVSIFFAVGLVTLLGASGAAIDYSRLQNQKSRFDAVADVASLAALTYVTQHPNLPRAALLAGAQQAANDAWKVNLSGDELAAKTPATVTLTSVNGQWTATVEYSGQMQTSLTAFIGYSNMKVSGVSEASTGTGSGSYWELFVAADTSSSMGIGATAADVAKMTKDTGCAFACHTADPKLNTLPAARVAGYKFRIDVVDNAIDAMMTELQRANSGTTKAGLYGFTSGLDTLVPLTGDLAAVKNGNLELSLGVFGKGNTNFKRVLDETTGLVGTSYDGSSAAKPRKAVFIITDGVQDTVNMESNVVTQVMPGHKMGTVDPEFCSKLKKEGNLVGVLYTDYVVPPGFEYFLAGYQNKILPSLKACASDNMFYNATTPAGITTALQSMLKFAMATGVRISR
jgi:Flp pilus assembly protein TadG